mgnify:CR=1 FL=1
MFDYDEWLKELEEGLEESYLSPLEQIHGKVVGYRQEAFYDVTVYADGYEYRYYVGD